MKLREWEFKLGECNEIGHTFFGNDEKCCCGKTNRRQPVELERDALRARVETLEAELSSAKNIAKIRGNAWLDSQDQVVKLRGALEHIGSPSRWPSSYSWERIANAMASHAKEALSSTTPESRMLSEKEDS